MLQISLRKQYGDMNIDMAFSSAGHVTGLRGPSGAGKTSILNMIAGLLAPDGGFIKLGEIVFLDSQSGINLPVKARRTGYIFQDARLFPHLTVVQNLCYGRWIRRLAADNEAERAIVQMLDIDRLLGRSVVDLSGGEKQRVAIGRALISRPSLLLLDEPLASLDEERKSEILPYLHRLKVNVKMPMVYVSHALDEVQSIADTIIEMRSGRIVPS